MDDKLEALKEMEANYESEIIKGEGQETEIIKGEGQETEMDKGNDEVRATAAAATEGHTHWRIIKAKAPSLQWNEGKGDL